MRAAITPTADLQKRNYSLMACVTDTNSFPAFLNANYFFAKKKLNKEKKHYFHKISVEVCIVGFYRVYGRISLVNIRTVKK
jgi:hypothetical protein